MKCCRFKDRVQIGHRLSWDFHFDRLWWSRCAVKGSLFQQVEVLPRQRSSRPGSYPSGRGGNEAVSLLLFSLLLEAA